VAADQQAQSTSYKYYNICHSEESLAKACDPGKNPAVAAVFETGDWTPYLKVALPYDALV
jgi:hypothetical protein